MARTLLAILSIALLGCGDKKGDSEKAPETTGTAVGDADKKPETKPEAKPEAPPSKAALCGCRMLTTHALDDLVGGKHKKMCGEPLLSGDLCDEVDMLRNCIYAAHGYTFKRKTYRNHFSSQSWYKARADFKDSDLSKLEVANVKALKDAGNACKAAKNLKPSKKEIAVLKKWFAKRTTLAPKIIVHDDGETSSRKEDLDAIEPRIGYVDLDASDVEVRRVKDSGSAEIRKQLKGKSYRVLDVQSCGDCDGNSDPDCVGERVCYSTFELVIGDKDEVLALWTAFPAG